VDEDGYVFYIPNVFLDRDYLSKEENGISIKVEMKGGFWF
jgi:tRNA(Ile)-lysidine synthase